MLSLLEGNDAYLRLQGPNTLFQPRFKGGRITRCFAYGFEQTRVNALRRQPTVETGKNAE